jgi:hypothetical protein
MSSFSESSEARPNLASASSVSRLPRERMRAITADRFRLEKTSAMDTDFTNCH